MADETKMFRFIVRRAGRRRLRRNGSALARFAPASAGRLRPAPPVQPRPSAHRGGPSATRRPSRPRSLDRGAANGPAYTQGPSPPPPKGPVRRLKAGVAAARRPARLQRPDRAPEGRQRRAWIGGKGDDAHQEGQILRRCVQGAGQAALNVRPEQPGAFASLVQAPALTGHADPSTGLGLAQTAFATKGGQGLTEGAPLGLSVIISGETGHAAIMPHGPSRG